VYTLKTIKNARIVEAQTELHLRNACMLEQSGLPHLGNTLLIYRAENISGNVMLNGRMIDE
jgi:hypothetical protein